MFPRSCGAPIKKSRKKEEKYKDSRFLKDAEKGTCISDIVREFLIAINELFIMVSSID